MIRKSHVGHRPKQQRIAVLSIFPVEKHDLAPVVEYQARETFFWFGIVAPPFSLPLSPSPVLDHHLNRDHYRAARAWLHWVHVRRN